MVAAVSVFILLLSIITSSWPTSAEQSNASSKQAADKTKVADKTGTAAVVPAAVPATSNKTDSPAYTLTGDADAGAGNSTATFPPLVTRRHDPIDLINGEGTCPECDLCIARAGRVKCFFAIHNVSWTEAKSSCENMNGELATIRSELETRFLNRTKYIMGVQVTNAWIGLRWKAQNNAWIWIDDVPVSQDEPYLRWAPGQPDNWSSHEDCVELSAADLYENDFGRYYTGYWNDQSCDLKRDAICQYYKVVE